MNTTSPKYFLGAIWVLIGLLVLVLIAFSVIRSLDIVSGAPQDQLFERRYLDHPIITAFHMFTGIVFLLFAPLQFNQKFRSKNLHRHRILGRILIVCALVSGVYGMLEIFVLPIFGGVASETAAFFFGPLFLFAIGRAYWCARTRQIALHREWIIRGFAIGLGVGTQRLVLLISQISGYGSFFDMFGPGLWLGFSINLLLAEIWINETRRRAN